MSRKELLYNTAYVLRACGKVFYNMLPVHKECGKVEGEKAQMRPQICGKCNATRYEVIRTGATLQCVLFSSALVYMPLASGINEQCGVKDFTCIW